MITGDGEAAEPARYVRTGITTLRIFDRPLDVRPGPPIEALEVLCEVTLDSPGRYEADPEIEEVTRRGFDHFPGTAMGLSRDELERALADDPGYYNQHIVQTDSCGRASFKVYFDGHDLSRFDRDGPWSFNCSFVRVAPDDSTRIEMPQGIRVTFLEAQTRRWRRDRFAQRRIYEDFEFKCGTPSGRRAWNESARRRTELERQDAAKAQTQKSR